jgi:hypothetical protein
MSVSLPLQSVVLDGDGKSVHLIVITGWGQEGDKRESQEAGYEYCWLSPLSPVENGGAGCRGIKRFGSG